MRTSENQVAAHVHIVATARLGQIRAGLTQHDVQVASVEHAQIAVDIERACWIAGCQAATVLDGDGAVYRTESTQRATRLYVDAARQLRGRVCRGAADDEIATDHLGAATNVRAVQRKRFRTDFFQRAATGNASIVRSAAQAQGQIWGVDQSASRTIQLVDGLRRCDACRKIQGAAVHGQGYGRRGEAAGPGQCQRATIDGGSTGVADVTQQHLGVAAVLHQRPRSADFAAERAGWRRGIIHPQRQRITHDKPAAQSAFQQRDRLVCVQGKLRARQSKIDHTTSRQGIVHANFQPPRVDPRAAGIAALAGQSDCTGSCLHQAATTGDITRIDTVARLVEPDAAIVRDVAQQAVCRPPKLAALQGDPPGIAILPAQRQDAAACLDQAARAGDITAKRDVVRAVED